MRFIRSFSDISIEQTPIVGGKNASLGEMFRELSPLGINIPDGFAVTAEAYRFMVSENGLVEPIKAELEGVDPTDVAALQKGASAVRRLILDAELPKLLCSEIRQAYEELGRRYGDEAVDVAVRSSATAEDLPEASFAGQQESYLNVSGIENVLQSVHRCFASLFTDRAVSYRASRGYDHFEVALSVGVQKMVRSDLASSGIMFTIDTESGSDRLILINGVWGLGENAVGGKVNPDEFSLFKPTLRDGKEAIIKRRIGSKAMTMRYADGGATRNEPTPPELQARYCIDDTEVTALANHALTIEAHYSRKAGSYRPMDIEWAKDGVDGRLYIVQARPETVQSQKGNALMLERQRLAIAPDARTILVSGTAVGERIGSGRVRIIGSTEEFHHFEPGEVLVADATDPDWEPVMKKAAAVITNRGGRTCHAAIVAREIGVPAIVGCGDATSALGNGESVTVSCAEGETGYVYAGSLEYTTERIDLSDLGEPRTRLFMNVGDPSKAFDVARLPNQGVGLARMEFIINTYVNAHPMALCEMAKGESVEEEEKIRAFMQGYDDPKHFFIDKLCEGVGTIAAAFYPKPVIVRTSDFKSNEYQHMTGGAPYERDEENPMIGFRGASRYYSENYKEAFMWECEALKRVRDTMGLENVKVMLPFVRTPDEGRKAIAVMNEAGLVQGENGLEVYAMCEIPANVILADEFLQVFDGYSIGSNDLTQLTLGVDRDSALIAHIFDERNLAVKRMLKMAIDACKKEGKYIGICGQAPSDYPEITEFLVENGIDSISLNPDSLLKMWQVVMELEARLK